MKAAIKGYEELLESAQSLDEIRDVGLAIKDYLETVVDRKDSKREQLVVLYRRCMAHLKVFGQGAAPLPDDAEPEELKMQATINVIDPNDLARYYGIATIRMTNWLAKEKGLRSTTITGRILHQTNKAVLFETGEEGEGNGWVGWLPKSQIVISES